MDEAVPVLPTSVTNKCSVVDPGHSIWSFPIGPQLFVAQILGGLVHCFEDEVTDLEAVVFHSFVEVLRDSLFVSGHF